MQSPPISPGGDPNVAGERLPDSLAEVRSPRQIRRARHRRGRKVFWQQYRKSKMGMAGLLILVFFAALAAYRVILARLR